MSREYQWPCHPLGWYRSRKWAKERFREHIASGKWKTRTSQLHTGYINQRRAHG